MFNKDEARTIVGIVGNVTALVLFLSPVLTFYRIWRKKAVEQYSAIPYLATFVNCGLWVVYGLPIVHPNSMLVVTINGAGFVIEVIYLSMFMMLSKGKKRGTVAAVAAAECGFMAALALCVIKLAHTTKLRSTIIGSICMAANILMYASPLSVMKMVITTKSVEFMPFSLSLFSFVNAVCWTSYAFIQLDLFILIPNGIGVVLGASQLLFYGMFYKSTKRIMAERKEIEATGNTNRLHPDV